MTCVVTGATGTVGRAVAQRLALSGRKVRLVGRGLLRLREVAATLPAEPGRVEARVAEYGDRASLESALRGARSVFLVTSDPLSPEHDEQLLAAAHRVSSAGEESVQAAGGVHLVKLSALAVTDAHADDLITRWQRENEDRLGACGLPWTLLRPRAFMSNTLSWASGIKTDRTVTAYGTRAPNACVDPRDVAGVAAEVLGDPAHHGRTYHLTGPQAVTPAEQTARLAELLDTPLRCVELGRAQAQAALRRRYPEQVAAALLAGVERQRAGAKVGTEPGVTEVTGRAAVPYHSWAADHLAAFR